MQKKAKIPAQKSEAEERFDMQLRAYKLPRWRREFQPIPDRRWRIDFAWPELSIAVEIEGGLYTQGRHVQGKGYEDDIEKYNAVIHAGWTLYRFSTSMVKDGTAIDFMRAILTSEE